MMMEDTLEDPIIMEVNTMITDETKKKLDMMGMHALVETLETQEKESLYKSMTSRNTNY